MATPRKKREKNDERELDLSALAKAKERESKRPKRAPCAGGCGRLVFTAFCDQCAPPMLSGMGRPARVSVDPYTGVDREFHVDRRLPPKKKDPDEGFL